MLYSQIHKPDQDPNQEKDQRPNQGANRGRALGHDRQRSQSSPPGNLGTITAERSLHLLPPQPAPKGTAVRDKVESPAQIIPKVSTVVRATLDDFPPLPIGGNRNVQRVEGVQENEVDQSHVLPASITGRSYASLFAKKKPIPKVERPETPSVEQSSVLQTQNDPANIPLPESPPQIQPGPADIPLPDSPPRIQLSAAQAHVDHIAVAENEPAPPLQDPSEDEIIIPFSNFADLFCPRLSSLDGLRGGAWPIPTFVNPAHAMAVIERLTKFHMGVLLVDSLAGEDRMQRLQGLNAVVDENMPGLDELGVSRHHIIFFYHGRGEMQMGHDIWDAIGEWYMGQSQCRFATQYGNRMHNQRRNALSSNAGGNVEINVREMQEMRQSTYRAAERRQPRQATEAASSGNSFARDDTTKNRPRGRNEEPQDQVL